MIKILITNKGFTLIEVMIFVALMAILMFIGTGLHSSIQWLTRENNYSNCIRELHNQKKIISHIPYDKLPPEVLTVQGDNEIKLSNSNILPESIIIMTQEKGNIDPSDFKVSENIITIKDKNYRGKKVLVKYGFLLAGSGEASTVPDKEPYEIRLLNTPLKTLTKIELVEGDNFTTIPSSLYEVKKGSKKIRIDKKYAGKVVHITYTGGSMQYICTGDFLNDKLNTVSEITDMKLIKIQASYGSRQNIESGILRIENEK
ncbi:MAG TPA: prepilin-type N-terminal cleavage/methylation domain-containing protein [Candidatus Eremiobacteraeota bacterium]|nr:prepilin-type N-terminal cleavage/methylation domain-containing protein [Candidatus Eremiobacteraeota bacterium]